jgi:isochorismate pyruvate lyase
MSFERALGKLGADLSSVVRTRMFLASLAARRRSLANPPAAVPRENVTDITRWEEFLSRLAPRRRSLASPPLAVPRESGRAHRERFGEHPPATTMVEVKALIAPEPLIEIEADAVAPRR